MDPTGREKLGGSPWGTEEPCRVVMQGLSPKVIEQPCAPKTKCKAKMHFLDVL